MLPGDDGCAGRTLWLLPHHTRFLESLVEIGYTRLTIKIIFRRMTGYLCAEAEARGLGPDAMNPAVMEELAEVCPQAVAVSTKGAMANVARRFAGYLVHAGVIEPVVPSPPAPDPLEGLCMELEHWLRLHRGMYCRRLQVHRNLLKRFMTNCCTSTGTVADLTSITSGTVFAFLGVSAG